MNRQAAILKMAPSTYVWCSLTKKSIKNKKKTKQKIKGSECRDNGITTPSKNSFCWSHCYFYNQEPPKHFCPKWRRYSCNLEAHSIVISGCSACTGIVEIKVHTKHSHLMSHPDLLGGGVGEKGGILSIAIEMLTQPRQGDIDAFLPHTVS